MYRELEEEVGLLPDTVSILGRTSGWLRYRLPKRYVRKNEAPVCIGQKQIWFLLRLVAPESDIRLDAHEAPEFDHWRWVSYWYPVTAVVDFKQDVYRQALTQNWAASARRRNRDNNRQTAEAETIMLEVRCAGLTQARQCGGLTRRGARS